MEKRNRIKIGVEIECIYNCDNVNLSVGSWENPQRINKSWSVKPDGSLRTEGVFENENTAEFVTKILGGKKTYNKALKEFQSFFNGKPLNEVLDFNSSCGNHIHIGLNEKKKYHNKLSWEVFAELRELFFNNIKGSEVLSEDTKQSILNHYFRGYASKINKTSWNGNRLNRGVEFNRQSENSGCGIEWRSINLCGVKSWEEFFNVFEIIYNCAEWLFNKRTTSHKGKFIKLRLNRAVLNDIQNKNSEKVTLEIKQKENSIININIQNKAVLECVI